MSLAALLKLGHVLLAFWFVAGLLARNLILSRAGKMMDVKIVQALVDQAGRFERLMVRPGSLSLFLFGLLTAWAQGWPVLGFLQGGTTNWLLASIVLYVSMVPIIPLIFLPRGKVFEAALEGATAQGTVTSTLTAAFQDRVVARAHAYELMATTLVVILMVTKPF
jgi:hypothetical protein